MPFFKLYIFCTVIAHALYRGGAWCVVRHGHIPADVSGVTAAIENGALLHISWTGHIRPVPLAYAEASTAEPSQNVPDASADPSRANGSKRYFFICAFYAARNLLKLWPKPSKTSVNVQGSHHRDSARGK